MHGADLGAYIAAMIGHRHADRVIGVHLQHLLEFRKPHLTDDDVAFVCEAIAAAGGGRARRRTA